MAVEATCPGCKEFFRLPDNLAGKQVCCQRCQTLWTVPQPSASTEEPELAEEVVESPAPPLPRLGRRQGAGLGHGVHF